MRIAEIQMAYYPKRSAHPIVTDSNEAVCILRENWEDGQIALCESFRVMAISNANRVLGIATIGKGGITACPVDVAAVMRPLLLGNATAVIVAHNHPSGKLTPSAPDKALTEQIAKACKIFGIRLLDHVILSGTDNDYYSFADNSIL